MAGFKFGRKQRLITTIIISMVFFAVEMSAGLYTGSLALVADAFHYLSDLLGFLVALVALIMSEQTDIPKEYTFGWQRATLLGAFFNGVFLLALGISILVQAIERFTSPNHIDNPKVVFVVGCIGLGLNLLVLSFLHDHDPEGGHSHGHSHSHSHGQSESHSHGHSHGHSHSHSHAEKHAHSEDEFGMTSDSVSEVEARELPPTHKHYQHKHAIVKAMKAGHDLGMMGVIIHVIGDAINNVGVIISALVIWKGTGDARFYIDPAIGVFIAVMIFCTAIPLTKGSGKILLQVAPDGINLEDVRYDMEMIPGVKSVHELHIWRLNQVKSIASAHVVVDDTTIQNFQTTAKTIMECLHAYGVHSATLQPEAAPGPSSPTSPTIKLVQSGESGKPIPRRQRSSCQLECSTLCGKKRCCPPVEVTAADDLF
ncbi:Putative Cation efflux system protein czcD [[Torrubiella] hemipterigena]|uniref:Putative Cation efflux system protein czcD n=1 Tax=[Torrubiella] hemipterigena TaxID=1531966 RepID=A0A0A1SZ73_9HYPO|nr:Putative Cation efflux system protein czcD [[Torrubiella] hemipterigena]